MYTVLVTSENELVTTVKERIMQRSKIVDTLHFLVEPMYNELDMTDFRVLLEYILPVSKQYCSELLTKSEELYKEMLEYKLPFDTDLTKEPGNIEVQLTFVKADLDPEGRSLQYVRKTSPTNITIVPISAWSDIIPDSALNAIDSAMVAIDAKIKALEEMAGVTATTKADNISLDTETNEIYLTCNGDQIGDRISIDTLTETIIETAEDEGLITMII